MTRSEILKKAEECVNGSRQEDYGNPEDNFKTIARLWADYLHGTGQDIIEINACDVAVMLALLKIARIASGRAKEDNFIDLAGYAACAGEIQTKRE